MHPHEQCRLLPIPNYVGPCSTMCIADMFSVRVPVTMSTDSIQQQESLAVARKLGDAAALLCSKFADIISLRLLLSALPVKILDK